eukprot:COSAG02_NODE_1329_length_13218_cov_16.986432_2_plen_909_part_00
MDRAMMAKLYEVTSDDDSKAPEDVLKAIVKGTVKSNVKDAALQDMAQWLSKRLATDHCGAKIKVLRLTMMIISNPKGGRFADAVSSEALDVIRATASFSCPPDPVHGDKPAEFVRASAAKCLDLLRAGSTAAPSSPDPKNRKAGSSGDLQVSTDGLSSPSGQSPRPSRGSGGSRSPTSATPDVVPSPISKDFAQAIQIDLHGREVMKLPLGGAMEEELETRQKKLYVYDVKPEDEVVDFEFTVVAPGDLPIGVFFTRKGGDVSYPLEGWAMSKYDMKDGTRRGCCEIASEGSIALVLDNSSSRLKTKTVKFAVQSRATTKQYEMDKKLAEMKAAQDRRAAAAREAKLGVKSSSSGAGGAARQGGPPKPRTPKPTKPKPVSSAAAAAAAYEAAEAEAEAAALFRGSVTGDLPSPGSPGSGGIKRRAKKKRPVKAADAARPPAAVDSNAPMDLDFIADAEAARKQQADIAASKRKAKQDAALKAKKELQKEDMKRKAAAKARARQSAKAQAEENAKRKAAEEERDRKEELRFQKQKEAQEQGRKAREEMEAEAQAALERARAAAEERRQAQAKAREEVVREKEARKAARFQAAEEARNQAAAKKAEEKAAKEELRKQREAEEAMKIEMYDQSGQVLRRLGRYTVQEENGYVRGWVCDICLQIKAGTFFFATSTVQGEEDPFRACARCLIDGDVIDLTDDLVFGLPGASIGDIKAADAGSSDDEAETGGADEGARAAAAKLLAKNRAIWAGEAVDGAELDAMSISATLSEVKMEKDAAKDDSLMTVYIRPGQWLGGSIGDGGKWVQDDRFSVRVPRTATWSELVTAVAASDQARDYSVTGGELDGAAEVPLDGAHPDLAAVNFFTGKTKKRIVSASEYANFPVPFPGQKAEVAKYGVLTRSQVIPGDAAMG